MEKQKAKVVASCLELLKASAVPIVAVGLADKLGLDGSRETVRRKVRVIVKALRDDGAMIAATINAGYFLTEDEEMYREYLDGKQIDAKRVLGETNRRKQNIIDAAGQGLLFVPGDATAMGS